MLLRHQEAAATATQGSSDEKKRHRGLVTQTSDKPAAIPPPTDRLNRTQRKRIAREAQKVKAALAQSTKPTKVSSASSAIVPVGIGMMAVTRTCPLHMHQDVIQLIQYSIVRM